MAVALLLYLGLSSYRADHIDFNEDVRPILNNHCLKCHGGVKQQGGISFLTEEVAFKQGESGDYALVAGHPERSALIHRVTHEDVELRMPPEGNALSKKEIKTLRRWIKQGGAWEKHWAYVLPDDEVLLETNTIDVFINSKLDEIGLVANERADRLTLLRRLYLDLIGLPPSQEELASYLSDESALAYEARVDLLLEDPRFGERWASLWMDLARYGDSQGYQKDPYRSIWRYRDWLIQAFNQNVPFDEFTVKQLAGDLLPEPTEFDLLATAFHRNTMTNDEGGTDDEEFRVAAVLDRVNTTWEVWQASTMSCVQCHSHPYDPLMHEDYYHLYAFFNNTRDADLRHEKPHFRSFSELDKQEIRRLAAEHGMRVTSTDSRDLASVRDELLSLPSLAPSDQSILREIRTVPTPIMRDLPADSSRQSFVFERGNWLVHGKEVQPDVPQSMPELQAGAEGITRLDLAQWLVSDENPLTARVAVNRFWSMFFGRGIVETLEDFGTMGSKPTHPALLDWLALQFKDVLHWDVKALMKLIVLSDAYQRSSVMTERQRELDPHNQYLARMTRKRLTAEQVRDQALAVAGLLSDKMYGPSVMPPQPEGVWQVIRNVMQWRESTGEDRYRRALYTFWRKSSPYPSLITFDSPSKELCVSRRITTNTPLQALTTLNDTVYVEAAEALADYGAAQDPDASRAIAKMYQRVLLRQPKPPVLEALVQQFDRALASYLEAERSSIASGPDQARDLAMTTVANVILNLDEVLVNE